MINNNNSNKLEKITAPYNFVPLNSKIYYPQWGRGFLEDSENNKFAFHDIPFKDAQSGEIEISIKAKSPIFVRNSDKMQNTKKNPAEFCNINGKFFIPGSSIKGVIRSVVEILSFSKITTQDKRFSYRDLNNPSYKAKAMEQNRIYMGWFYKKDGVYKIDSLGKISQKGENRIKYDKLRKYLGSDLVDKIQYKKQAYEKYSLFSNDMSKLNIDLGSVVFTGSTGKKTREFLFPKKILETFELDEKIISTFKEAYLIGTINESLNWTKIWKNIFEKGGKVPVFFQMQDDEILHFGLSMLYKLPYQNSNLELIKNYSDYDEDRLDFSQCLFGMTNKKTALKGRVYFSHFLCEKAIKCPKIASLPLSSPRATFFPSYLVQCQDKANKTQNYITFDNKNAIIRGYKLYPPQQKTTAVIESGNEKILTFFKPLDSGSTFKGKVKFHNLKKEELGLLLLSLNLLNDEKCYHKIGMAKPYGFGTIKIKINNINLYSNDNFESKEYEQSFIKLLNNEINIDFLNNPRIKAFKKLSSYGYDESELKYMQLKDFANAKKQFNKFCLKEVVENGYDKSKLCKKNNNNQQNKSRQKPKKDEPFNNPFANLKK